MYLISLITMCTYPTTAICPAGILVALAGEEDAREGVARGRGCVGLGSTLSATKIAGAAGAACHLKLVAGPADRATTAVPVALAWTALQIQLQGRPGIDFCHEGCWVVGKR